MFLTSRSIWSLLTFVTIGISASASHAQAVNVAAPTNSGDPFGEAKERRSRETALRSIAMIGANKRDPREQQAFLKQLNDDFTQIQIIRLNMVKNISDGRPFEFKRLASNASEIRKRAARLRSSLALRPDNLPEPKDQKAVEYNDATIQDAASSLCVEISRFTTNPLFKENAVYNLRFATEADNALQTIIALSDSIKNSAYKLRHTDNER